jgi:hypothetical protein
MISKNVGMKTVVQALLLSAWPIVNVMMMLLLVWLMFAILGVKLFSGKFSECEDSTFPAGAPRHGQFDQQLARWVVLPCERPKVWGVYSELAATNHSSWTQGPDIWESMISQEPSGLWQWQSQPLHFDNTPGAMLTLFVMSSMEGWPTVMYRACDTTLVDHEPQQNANQFFAYYFVIFLVIGGFFFLSLFVSTIFENFINLKQVGNLSHSLIIKS